MVFPCIVLGNNNGSRNMQYIIRHINDYCSYVLSLSELSEGSLRGIGDTCLLIIDNELFGPICSLEYLFDYYEQAIEKECNIVGLYDVENGHHMIFLNVVAVNYLKSMCSFDSIDEIVKALKKKGCSYTNIFSLKSYEKESVSLRSKVLLMKGCPFLEKKIWSSDNIKNKSGDLANIRKSIISKGYYDFDIILDELIKKNNINHLRKALQLVYISDDKFDRTLNYSNIGIVVHLHYLDRCEECMEYLQNVPKTIPINVYSSNKRLLEKLKILYINYNNIHFFFKENRGRDVSTLLIESRDFILKKELVCFIHDKKDTPINKNCFENAWQNMLWNCMLASKEHISYIISLFGDNKKLGLLVPPEPFHEEILNSWGGFWGKNYDNTLNYLNELGITPIIDKQIMPITLGTVFWARTDAIRLMFKKNYNYYDFPSEPMAGDGTISHAIERSVGYIAQHQGYYTAIIMDKSVATQHSIIMSDYLERSMRFFREHNLFEIPK